MPRLSLIWPLCVGIALSSLLYGQSPAALPGVADLPDQPELPPVLTMRDGTPVTSPAQWPARRAEMRQTLEYYATGSIPPAPGNVVATELKSERVQDGAVLYRLVHLAFGPDHRLGLDAAVFTPADRPGPFPTFIHLSFFRTPGAVPLPLIPVPPSPGKKHPAAPAPPTSGPSAAAATAPAPKPAALSLYPTKTPAETAAEHAELFRRGYALVQIYYQDCGEDCGVHTADGGWANRTTRFFPAYPGYDWGLNAAWAWGLSRCVDYCLTQPFADPHKLIAIGHSRLGKAVLIAGAFDERFALSAPVGSGAGGTGAYRFNGSRGMHREGLDDVVRKFPYWFSPQLKTFRGHVDRLPFDQHWFIALTAPRPFIMLEGTLDQICEENAAHQAWLGARPAYALLGVANKLGVNYAPHKHDLAPADWTAAMDFADWQLRGMKPARSFDSFP